MSILDTVIGEVVEEYGNSRASMIKRKIESLLGPIEAMTADEGTILYNAIDSEKLKAQEEALVCIKDELRWLVKNAFKPDINNHPRF